MQMKKISNQNFVFTFCTLNNMHAIEFCTIIYTTHLTLIERPIKWK